MLGKVDREAKMAIWLQRLRESSTPTESLADTARRCGWKLDEAYRWVQILRRAGHWPASTRRPAADKSKAFTKKTALRFARVRIATEAHLKLPVPLRVQLQLANGRRAELTLEDEAHLPRILKLIEQSA